MQGEFGDQGVKEPVQEHSEPRGGLLEPGFRRQGVLDCLASAMAQNIVCSFLHQRDGEEGHPVPLRGSPGPQGRLPSQEQSGGLTEDLAREIASAVIAAALGDRRMTLGTVSDPNPGAEFQVRTPSSGARPSSEGFSVAALGCDSPLSLRGSATGGSLDYPDAPPTTPILPQPVKEMGSFARKLKDGLAKEFLPSPPPPTPKDGQVEAGALENGGHGVAADPRVALMEHLMCSLMTGTSGGERPTWCQDLSPGIMVDSYGDDEGPQQDRAKMAAYAERISGEIIGWVTSRWTSKGNRGGSTKEFVDDGDLHRLAEQLAKNIITLSLKDVEMALR